MPGRGPPARNGRPLLSQHPPKKEEDLGGGGRGPSNGGWWTPGAPTSAVRARPRHGCPNVILAAGYRRGRRKMTKGRGPNPPLGSRSLECGRVAGNSGGGTRAASSNDASGVLTEQGLQTVP
jgi:hypothetical protein